jgi:hypothetical protein
LILIACLALVASVTGAAKANPIMGTVTLTVAPAGQFGGNPGLGIPTAAAYSSGPVDLGALPSTVPLTGPELAFNGGLIEENIATTFDLKIALNSASGSQPSVDLSGPLRGWVASVQSPNVAGSSFWATPTSASLQGWAAGLGVPMALIGQ